MSPPSRENNSCVEKKVLGEKTENPKKFKINCEHPQAPSAGSVLAGRPRCPTAALPGEEGVGPGLCQLSLLQGVRVFAPVNPILTLKAYFTWRAGDALILGMTVTGCGSALCPGTGDRRFVCTVHSGLTTGQGGCRQADGHVRRWVGGQVDR